MKSPCKYPGCRALLDKSGYCDAHIASAPNHRRDYDQGRRRNDPALRQAAAIRNSARWKRVQRLKLLTDPLCEDPHGDHARRNTTETATQVHHVKGLATHPELAFEFGNLMSLCAPCHAKAEAMARSQPRDSQSPPEPPQEPWCGIG